MSYRILETDEASNDLALIAIKAYDYTGSIMSAKRFLSLYNDITNRLELFPLGFRGVCIEYRGYEIRMCPFGNYNIFFIVNDTEKTVTVLRILYQKQNWEHILNVESTYHLDGRAV